MTDNELLRRPRFPEGSQETRANASMEADSDQYRCGRAELSLSQVLKFSSLFFISRSRDCSDTNLGSGISLAKSSSVVPFVAP